MTREETKTILATMSAVYPCNLMPPVTELTVNVWFQLLQDLPYKLATTALGAWLATNKYPATPADIRSQCVASVKPTGTAEAAWGKLQEAVRRHGHTDPDSAKAMMDSAAWTIVARFGWRYFCDMPCDEESTYFAQFRNAYNAEQKKETERLQIPERIRKALSDGKPMIEDGK